MHYSKDIKHGAVPIALPVAFAGMDLGGVRSAAGAYRARLKRVFDVSAIVIAAPIMIPVMALMTLIIAMVDGNPFYTQRRVGLHGRSYTMWKFRTMVADADATLAHHLAADPVAHAEWNRSQKLKNDPRITPMGRMLRKTSLDELPQLINVLKGEMSLVGPRPMLPEQQIMYPGTAYYQMVPGITGPWQVGARNDTGFAERAAFDTSYQRTCSFIGDVKLLFATIAVVTRATGH